MQKHLACEAALDKGYSTSITCFEMRNGKEKAGENLSYNLVRLTPSYLGGRD
jgi:hypothetical protein